jgi:hypothetical protein
MLWQHKAFLDPLFRSRRVSLNRRNSKSKEKEDGSVSGKRIAIIVDDGFEK